MSRFRTDPGNAPAQTGRTVAPEPVEHRPQARAADLEPAGMLAVFSAGMERLDNALREFSNGVALEIPVRAISLSTNASTPAGQLVSPSPGALAGLALYNAGTTTAVVYLIDSRNPTDPPLLPLRLDPGNYVFEMPQGRGIGVPFVNGLTLVITGGTVIGSVYVTP